MKRRIHQNVWGNWNGYIGRRKVHEFGTDEDEAKLWLNDPVRYDKEQAEAREQSAAKLAK